MSRPRTPTALMEARNSFKAHPERRRDSEPSAPGHLGAVPDRLDDIERQAWMEVVTYAPIGVLTAADRHQVEELATLLAESWTERREFQVGKRALLNKMLGQLGMNPSDRSRLSVPKEKDVNAFSTLG